jgi:hypothetical protein
MYKDGSENAGKQNGKCLCAAVEFEVLGQLPNLYHCYCSLCQKQTGGSHNTATLVNDNQFKWLKGEESIATFTKATGFSSYSCRHCGCPVPNPLKGTNKYWIPVGLLDCSIMAKETSNEAPKVVLHMHLDSRAPWQSMPEQGHQYGTMPDFTTICSLLEP